MAMSDQQNTFVPPTVEQRAQALGETDELNEDIRRALTVSIDESFPPIPMPGESDWLNAHYEPGQTVKQFQSSQKTQPHPKCNIISIQPFGDFTGPRSPSLDIIRDFSHLFFPGCQTKLLPSIDFDSKIEKRINAFTNQPQYLVSDLIAHLKNRNNRQELFSIIVTMVDIYPDPEWNFVYGQASIQEGIAVYSFARFDPLFPHSSQQLSTDKERILILKRAVSTYLHETIHLFGLAHCIYYLCLMNGANCEMEMDRPLVYLCPICLRKMYEVFQGQNYHVIEIYQNILELSKKIGFQEEANWYESRLKILNKHSSEKF